MSENAKHYCTCVTPRTQNINDRAALLDDARWGNGAVIRVAFLDGDQSLRERVEFFAKQWTGPGMANLQLKVVTSGSAEIRIAFIDGDGSWSVLGTECKNVPDDEPTMNYGWLTPASSDDEVKSVVLHEFGHALGLIHEHQNPRGGIKWNEPAVIADLSGPPNNWDEDTIRHNVLDHYPEDEIVPTPLDPLSIMMYPIPAAWTRDGFSTGFNNDLSAQDRQFIPTVYPQSRAA